MGSKIINVLIVLAVIGYVGYYLYKLPKYNEGEVAPDFKTNLIDGSEFQLSSLKGNIVLLDFWGSWCGPCRQESPNLVGLHKKFGALKTDSGGGFKIVSVAIETNDRRWKKAIDQDNLNWPHHIYEEGRFKSPIAQQYGVKEIPTKYLIDTKGKVVFTNPGFEQIDNYLSDRLK